VFLQQLWCVDNRETISYFCVTFKLLKNWNWNTAGTEKYQRNWNCN